MDIVVDIAEFYLSPGFLEKTIKKSFPIAYDIKTKATMVKIDKLDYTKT
jgi:hypothetical protein